ncbi:MAG: hypothetical protein KBD67_08205 [Anaerolineaceae bacterium]|nr:hypothetical protein [Anaerolineaceae bacterium]
MGRTILSATQTWVEEDKALRRFARALRKDDQELLQDLLALSRRHIAEASYASNLYPMDIYLVSMLLEMYRKVRRLEQQLEALGVEFQGEASAIPELPSLIDLVDQAVSDAAENEAAPSNGVEYVELLDGA